MFGSVNSIETLGAVDGPGLRTVVFLNGCHLRCKYCHNPEMWMKLPDNIGATELAQKIIRNKPYFKNGGGVTFSGGEPLLQSAFLIEVSKILKENDIHIALDTAGYSTDYELLNYVDLVILDIKDITKERFSSLTNGDLDIYLSFINKLKELNKKIWLRHVIVPGIHDNDKYINDLGAFIKKYFTLTNIDKIEFLPFHKLGIEKYKALSLNYSFEDTPEMNFEVCQSLYVKLINILESE